MTLYELTGQWKELLEWAEDGDIDDQALTDTLEGLEGEIEDKADGYAKILQQLKADSDALKKETDRLAERKRTIDSRIGSLKKSLLMAMKATGKTKFKTQLFSFSISKNPEAVVLDTSDLEKIPAEYITQPTPQINKAAIKDALKGGAMFEFAHLEQGEGVRIR